MEQKRPADIIQELLDYLWNGLGLEEKCQYEDALIQPPRGVLDINMGNYASGGR